MSIHGFYDKGKDIDELIVLVYAAYNTVQLSKENAQQKEQINMLTYRNEFIGKFTNLVVEEVNNKAMATAGMILGLEDYKSSIAEEDKEQYDKYINTIKSQLHELTELVQALEIKHEILNVGIVKNTLQRLLKLAFMIDNSTLNIQGDEYLNLGCDANTLIYILVEIIEYLISQNVDKIDIICEKENDSTTIKICHKIESNDLYNRVNNLAMFDNNITINKEYDQIIIKL